MSNIQHQQTMSQLPEYYSQRRTGKVLPGSRASVAVMLASKASKENQAPAAAVTSTERPVAKSLRAHEDVASLEWDQVLALLDQLQLEEFAPLLQDEGFESINSLAAAEMEDLVGPDGIQMKKGQARLLLKAAKSKVKKKKKGGAATGTKELEGGEFVGELKDGKAYGMGIWQHADGKRRYEGQFKSDRMHGQGTYTWPDGRTYEGEWVNDAMEGQGTMTYANGAVYRGEWKNDERSGKGTYTYPDGSQTIGMWKHDVRDGLGSFTSPDGSKYEGNYANNKRYGQGSMNFPSGAKYQGSWRNDMQDGFGAYTYPDGRTYVGWWRADEREGRGTETFADNSKRVGQWVNDKLHGPAVFTHADGVTVDNEKWEMDIRLLE